MTDIEDNEYLIAVAAGEVPADLVIKNAKLVDVFNHRIIEEDLAIANGKVAGFGRYDGREEIDAGGAYVAPALIDGHVHIESSMLAPRELEKILLPRGVATIIADPHEIANVKGAEGIQWMLDQSENLTLDVRINLPSSVPAAPMENNGAILKAENLDAFYNHPRVLGLAEVMDFPAVAGRSEDMMEKISAAKNRGKIVDGHGAGLDKHGINIYAAAGIQTDHECTNAEEAEIRLSRGMYVLLREGSAARDVKQLLPVVTPYNSRRCLFCTDDKHLDDLVEEGSIDYNIRLSVENGLDPITAIQMATINAAECYGLKNKGALAPGFDADFIFFDRLEDIQVRSLYLGGRLAAEDGQVCARTPEPEETADKALIQMNRNPVKEEELALSIPGDKARVIGVSAGSLVTENLEERVATDSDRKFIFDRQKGIQKIVVAERHRQTDNIGVGLIKGFEMHKGAVAGSIAHDSHNIVATGTNDRDLAFAINEVIRLKGGIAVVADGEVLASVALPVAGLITTISWQGLYKQLKTLNKKLEQMTEGDSASLLISLSFMALPVIPELKITDQGLFDVRAFKPVPVSI